MIMQAHTGTSLARAKSSLVIGFTLPCLQGNTEWYSEPQDRTSLGVGARKM